ncbi:RTA1 protein, partial [Aureobasidium melanogenum]
MAFSYYEYFPSKAAAVIACLIFVTVTILHTWQLFRTRTWFFIPFVIGGLFEVIGYAARAKSASQHPDYTLMPYILQSLFLLLAPTLFAASIYMELGRILDLTEGESRSAIRRRLLTKIFVMGDVLSFLAQSAGGGMLAQGSSFGNKIIIGGLVLQLLFFGFFMASAVVFDRRMSGNPTTKVMAMPLPWKKHLHALYAGSIMILVRSLYRLIEYVQGGSSGYIVEHEWTLYIFDAALMFGTMLVFFWIHPSEIRALLRGGPALQGWMPLRVLAPLQDAIFTFWDETGEIILLNMSCRQSCMRSREAIRAVAKRCLQNEIGDRQSQTDPLWSPRLANRDCHFSTTINLDSSNTGGFMEGSNQPLQILTNVWPRNPTLIPAKSL